MLPIKLWTTGEDEPFLKAMMPAMRSVVAPMQTWRQLPFPGFAKSFRYGPTSCSAGMGSNIRSSDLGTNWYVKVGRGREGEVVSALQYNPGYKECGLLLTACHSFFSSRCRL